LKTKSGDAMKALMLSKLAMVAVAAIVMAVQAMAQKAAKPQPAVQQNKVQRVIVVSLEDRKLALVEDGQVKKVYSVAVGKPSTPSPVGSFTIERRVGQSDLSPQWQDRPSGTGQSGGHALDGPQHSRLRNPRNQ
jgi:lipoprotein-anchoring transpeptidase ErfK/SrfK